MENLTDLEKFEQDLFLEEKEEFLSNKCSDCMNYLNEETEECDNNFCIGKIPEEYRQQKHNHQHLLLKQIGGFGGIKPTL